MQGIQRALGQAMRLLAIVALPLAAQAQGKAEPPPSDASTALAAGARVLSLDDAIAQALDTNFGIRLARHDLASVQSSLLAEQNVFDFKLTTRLKDNRGFHRSVPIALPPAVPGDPVIIVSRDVLSDDQRASLNLEREAQWGGRFGLETGLTRVNTEYTDVDPLHEADVIFRYAQPLLRGAGRKVATAGLVSAETALRSQSRSLAAEEMSLVVDVTRAFHQVTRSAKVIRIDRDATMRAEENLRTYRVRLEEGLITPIDVARAEGELRQRESVVVSDESSLRSARDRLAFLLGLPVSTDLDLEERAPSLEPLQIDMAGAVGEALQQRVSVMNQRESLALAELSSHVARSNTRAQLDLAFSVGASTIVDDDPSAYLKLDDNDDWRTGIDLAYTFNEKSDDEAYVRARISEEKQRLDLSNLERSVELEVRGAVRDVQALERSIDLLGKNFDLARESLRLAQLQLQEDLIRTTDLLQIQSDVVQAETAYTNAVADHAIALVNLDLALGRYRTDTLSRKSSFLRDAPAAMPSTAPGGSKP